MFFSFHNEPQHSPRTEHERTRASPSSEMDKAASLKLVNKMPEWNEGMHAGVGFTLGSTRSQPANPHADHRYYSLITSTDLQSLVLRFNKGRVLAPSAKNFLMCIQHGAGAGSENGV